MNEPITAFTGPYRFLSNFWPVAVEMDGEIYPSVEHAYQAAKTVFESERALIRDATTPEAKKLGQKVTLRSDWESVKIPIMYELVAQKFENNKEFKRWLLSTRDRELIEGNWWGDTFWGVCRGQGRNELGKILMEIRKKLRDEITSS